MYRHPALVDISHFRAPYKNLSMQLSGLSGAHHHQESTMHYSTHGFGQDENPLAESLYNKQDGMYVYKPEVAASVLSYLEQHRTLTLGTQTGERLVQVAPYHPDELQAMENSPQLKEVLSALNARKWVDREVANGNVVFASSNILQPAAVDKYLAAIPASNRKRVREAASQPYSGILIAPKGALTAGMGMLGWGLAAVAVAGIGYVVVSKNKSRY